ncbi:MAG: lysylphosphatidylglycerol synthase transmembrane domain-containing protein [Azoarcus sp.]|nr:lysylphosphatidylglycerol synthase transmembrane domain-containing protein [Azoarcus sp.]
MRRLRRVGRVLLRLAFSAGLLALLLWWLKPDAVFAALGPLSPGWVLPALALGVPQVFVSAWRWRLTAACLGLALPLGVAFREYYLASFLNQVLPGGVGGDLTRAWRHAGAVDGGRAPWHAVLIERASGQLALLLVGGAALALSPALRVGMVDAIAALPLPSGVWALGGLAVGLLAFRRLRPALAVLWRDARLALFARTVLPLQLLGSLALVASYIAVYFCCARAIGIGRPAAELLPLIPPVLLAMAIPLSVAGWGVREGAAALVWLLAGLPPAEGVAISVVYGVVVLVSSLPGAAVLLAGGAGHRRGAQPS